MPLDLKNEGLNKSNTIKLYHGSKSGIVGNIKPCSRSSCDFGSGFYMGTMREQAFSMVCGTGFPERKFYETALNLTGMNVLHLDGMQWLFFILCCRSEFTDLCGSILFDSVMDARGRADIVVGLIADDKMLNALQSFYDYLLTDVGLYRALMSVSLGEQYVAVSEKGCSGITCKEVIVSDSELHTLRIFNARRIDEGNNAFASTIKNYRSTGKSLDELIDSDIMQMELQDLPSDWEEVVRRYKRK